MPQCRHSRRFDDSFTAAKTHMRWCQDLAGGAYTAIQVTKSMHHKQPAGSQNCKRTGLGVNTSNLVTTSDNGTDAGMSTHAGVYVRTDELIVQGTGYSKLANGYLWSTAKTVHACRNSGSACLSAAMR